MNRTAIEGSLEIDVTDFGPIAQATVNLRPLTVFVGPSNTGKSYLAILIYALHRFFGGDGGFGNRRFHRADPFFIGRRAPELSDESIDNLMEIVRLTTAERKSEDARGIVLTPAVADVFRYQFDKNAEALADEIGRCFGIGDTHTLTRKGRTKAARIAMRRRMSNDLEFGEHTLSLGRKTEFRTTIPGGIPIPVDYETIDSMKLYVRSYLPMLDEGKSDIKLREFATMEMMSIVGDLLMPSAVGVLHLPAFYLPADRTGVMHAHTAVVSALIASAPRAGLRPAARTPTLSGVLADFLEQLIEIDLPEPGRRKRLSDLSKRIEKDVLDGSIRINRSTSANYPHFAYRPEGWKDDLALANASSMVSELAPVVLYLRHLVRPGNVLIVEEPESHLHPAMQVAFTRNLSALVNAGINLIVTTHSEWLLEELANIVRRSELPESKRGSFAGDVALRREQVGAWLFEPKSRPKGSIVKEIRLDDTGMYPTGYDEVSTALHNDWAELSSRIKDS